MDVQAKAKQKTIWILQTGEPLPIDEGNPRPMRAMNLTNALIKKGHRVVLWSSRFSHQEKKHRENNNIIKYSDQLEIRLLDSPGYKRNIGFSRLRDHLILAKNLKKQLILEKHTPDVAFIGYPPIEVAAVMSRWLKSRGIPCLLDIKDQWPGIFEEVFPPQLQKFVRILLWPYYYYGKRAMREVTALVSITNSFLDWALSFSKRVKTEKEGVFLLTGEDFKNSHHGDFIIDARAWLDGQGILSDNSVLRLVYIGSLTRVLDFSPIKDAAISFLNSQHKVEFIICGEGGASKEIRAFLSELSNVRFLGWVDKSQAKALAERSHLALIPYKNTDDFKKTLPNKIFDALCLGLPVLSPLEGEVKKLIEDHAVGLHYNDREDHSLKDCIQFLIDEVEKRLQMSKNALMLYENNFTFEKVYGSLVNHLGNLTI